MTRGAASAKILVVDDMAVFREPIAAALRARGYETICATNGREALGLVKTHRPDLILLDLTMPVMDGLEYLRAVRDDQTIPRPPVILLTAVADRESVIHAGRLGASDYLLKSAFSMEEMLARVDRCLGAATTGDRKAAVSGRAARVYEKPAPAGENGIDGPREAMAALRARRPLLTSEQLRQRLAAGGELKAFSPAVTRVLKLTQDEASTISSIAGAISQDHAMAVRILKLANSTVYARGAPVETVERAVMRIGLSHIRQVMLSIGVIDQFSTVRVGDTEAGLFWEHGLACGIIAADLARGRGAGQADAAFTTGLLHDVGRLIFVQQLQPEYGAVLQAAEELRLPLEQVESHLLGVNHAEGMEHVLAAWHFPRNLVDPIVGHHASVRSIRRLAPGKAAEVATVALADRLSHSLGLGASGNETIYPTEELCGLLGLEEDVIGRIEGTARSHTAALKRGMLAESGDAAWVEPRERYRPDLATPMRPLYVSAAPRLDAHRIFCDQVADAGDAPPNVAVVHVRDAQERGRLTKELAAAEASSRVAGLPLVVLSPAGDLGLDAAAMTGRRALLLPTPITMSRLLEAIGQVAGESARHEAA